MNILENEKNAYSSVKMSQVQVDAMRDKIEQAKEENRKMRTNNTIKNTFTAVAAAVLLVIILPNTSASVAQAMGGIPVIGKIFEVVTFRNYHYEDENYYADINVPEIIDKSESSNEVLNETINNVNQQINEISDKIIEDFKNTTLNELGVKDVVVNSEVITSNEKYFTLKLNCYESQASGYEWNYYYTIDLSTGKLLALKDLYPTGYDYIDEISSNIISQMEEAMAKDENISYWLHEEELGDENFSEISEDTLFYINEQGNIVVVFNEGEVAPSYMGVQYFEIPYTVKK